MTNCVALENASFRSAVRALIEHKHGGYGHVASAFGPPINRSAREYAHSVIAQCGEAKQGCQRSKREIKGYLSDTTLSSPAQVTRDRGTLRRRRKSATRVSWAPEDSQVGWMILRVTFLAAGSLYVVFKPTAVRQIYPLCQPSECRPRKEKGRRPQAQSHEARRRRHPKSGVCNRALGAANRPTEYSMLANCGQ